MPLRQLLARHPAVVEATRAAATLTASLCQFVVFERSWCYIVAASGGDVLQPRRLVEAESDLFSFKLERDATDDVSMAELARSPTIEVVGTASFPVVDRFGVTVGALTTHGPVGERQANTFLALARVVSGIVVSHDFSDSVTTGQGMSEAAIVHGLRDAVIVIDEAFQITWANDALGSLVARSRVELIGTSAIDLIHPDDLGIAMDAVARVVTGLTVYRVLLRISNGEGSWGRVELTGTDQSANPEINGIVISLRSAELELEVEQDQHRSRNMSDALVEQLHDGIIATDAIGAITLVNRAAYSLFGIDPETPPGRLSWRDFPLLDSHGTVVVRGHHPARVIFGAIFDDRGEMSIVSQDGRHHYVDVAQRSVVGDDGTLHGSFVTFHDVTATREAQNELVSQALHDQLTGLPNRRMLSERLAALKNEWRETGKSAPEVACCFLDLDVFKLINDTHGHRTGDQMIRIAAERLADQLRGDDLLVRQGGDEFVALLPNVESEVAVHLVAERLRASLSEPFFIDGIRFDITASAGVALAKLDDLDEDELLSQADIALYAAKARGRNRTEIFDTALEVATEAEDRQRRMLRHALDNDGIVMHFQPLVDATTGKTIGFEALARCLDEAGTLHGPGAFLDSIAGSGLVWELDQHAFGLSCAAAAVIGAAVPGEPPVMSCNFSPLSIIQPDFVSFVLRTTEEAGLGPKGICIEITESAAFAGGSASLNGIQALHEAGFSLALDDFGTGYSSLSHLRDLPLSSVKVDKSFVDKLIEQGSERAIAQAVVGLAKDLGMGVVAEGVETEHQLAAAQELGFSVIQGWHYAAAMPLDDLLHKWLGEMAQPSE